MVRTSVLSAWAKLQVASGAQPYLLQVMEPHIATLTPLWLSSLREFARLKFEPDISNTLGTSSDDSLDTTYAALNRQTLLKVSTPFETRTQSKEFLVLSRLMAQACRRYCQSD